MKKKPDFKIADFAKRSFLFIAATVVLFSCDTKYKLTAEDHQQLDSINIVLDVLQDSIDASWTMMLENDNLKHDYLDRVLLEITYSDNYDKDVIDSLSALINTLRGARYSSKYEMTSEKIDEYDSLTMLVSEAVLDYAINHPARYKTQLIDEISDEIGQMNNMLLMNRVHYDDFVLGRNELIRKYKDKALLRDTTFDTLQLPVFQIPA